VVFPPGLLLLGFLGGVTGALAQGVLTQPSETYERTAASQGLTTNVTTVIPPLAGPVAQAPGPFQLGPVDFHPHLLYRFLYGDGIPAGPTNHLKTAIQEISPGLLLDLGRYWTLDYTPTVRLYSNPHLPDGTDELVVLAGKTSYQDWGFNLSQTYSSSSAPLLETEALTEQENYRTDLQASKQLGNQLSAQAGLDQDFQSISYGTISQNIRQWTATAGLNDQFWPRFGVGFTGSAGYDLITPGANMTFEQAQGTMNWRVQDKMTMTATAGLEVTQLRGAELINPTYSGTVAYRPWEQTSASLTASRSVSPSFYADDILVNTTISAAFQQQFLQHFTFDLSGGYTTTPYVGFATVDELNPLTNFHQIGVPVPLVRTATVQQNREDYFRFVRVSVGSTFRKRGSVSIFYSFSDYTSGSSVFSLTSTQVGIEIGWRY
jgi:hypothetical protein